MSFDLKQIKVLGYTTDFNSCDCCGKENLKGTISILDLTTDVVLHFGTTCAVKADKYDTLNAFNEAKKEINKIKMETLEDKRFAWLMRKKHNICESKTDALTDAYLSWRSNAHTRFAKFDFASWK